MTHIAQMAGVQIDNKEHGHILNKILKIGAWLQIIAAIFVGLIVLYIVYRLFIKKKSIKSQNRGWK